MAAYNKFNLTVQDWLYTNQNFNSDTFKAMLGNTSPVATQNSYTGSGGLASSELASGSGYVTGGALITIGNSNASGTETITASASSPTWTGSGGGFGPFRYITLYDSTTNYPVAWFDYGSSLSLNAGDTFTLNFGANLFTLV